MQCAVYARISRDLGQQAMGVARQVEDCTAKAKSLGWTVAETFTDNDVSASKSVPRPEYERMLAGIRDGSVKAVVVYDLDRLTRKVRELEDFIDLTEQYGVSLANVSGDVDLTSANGRMIARIKGAVARQEAERIAERTKRQKEQRAQSGKPMGQRFRTFGYSRAWEVREDEAAVVREVFRRAAAGESQNGITRDLVARGVLTAAGGTWTALQTSRMLKTHKYAGLQTFRGKVIGKSEVPAIVTEAEFDAVQNLSNGSSFNFRKYLLSGILICDECKNPMSGFRVGDGHRYRCETRTGGCGRVTIKGEWIDAYVDRYMSWWVLHEAHKARGNAQPTETNEAEIAAIDERIAGFQEAMGTGDLEIADAMAAIKAARKQRQALAREDAARVVEQVTQESVHASYDALSADEKRVQIKRVFEYIFIKPGRRVRYFDVERIYVLRKSDGELVAGGAMQTVDYRDPDHLDPDYVFDPARGF